MSPQIIKINEDVRGAIFLVKNLLEGDKEFTFLETKRGFARGGCIHQNEENFVVIKGKIKFIIGSSQIEFNQGESGIIPAKTPHAFISIEDSIVSEWGITTQEKMLDEKDKSMRDLIEKINKSNL